jgi:hypothetical protein
MIIFLKIYYVNLEGDKKTPWRIHALGFRKFI